MLWLRIGVSLLHFQDVSIIMKYILSALSLSLLFVIQPEISLRQSPICVRERFVSAIDKYAYTWVSSAYIWWSYLWPWIRELSNVVYKVNSSCPRTEPWTTPQYMLTASEKQFLIFINWDLFAKRIQVSAVSYMPYQSARRSRRTEYSMVSKAADKYNSVTAVIFPVSMFSVMSLWTFSRAISVE